MDLRGINMNNNTKWQSINSDELHEHVAEWTIVDIRDPNAFSQGHIPRAFNLNNSNIQNFVNETDFDKPLVVVCYVGNSSKGAADILCNAGFNNVYSLNGGMSFWRIQHPELVEMG